MQWGIGSTTFIGAYVTVGVLAVALAWVRREQVRRGGAVAHRDLSPTEVGFLTGGTTRAIFSAVCVLRAEGVLGADRGRLSVSGSRPAGLDPVSVAVFDSLQAAEQYEHKLYHHRAVRDGIDEMERRLARDGYVVDPVNRFGRPAFWLLLAATAVALVRLGFDIADSQPIGWLVLAIVLTWIVALIAWGFMARIPVRTRAADQALGALRSRYSYLAPAHRPAWTTYGPALAGVSAGLFGAAALAAADPEFAAGMRIPWTSDPGGGAGGGADGGGDAGVDASGCDSGNSGGCGSSCSSCGGCSSCSSCQ